MRIFNRYYSAYDLLLVFGDLLVTMLAVGAVQLVAYLSQETEMAHWPVQGMGMSAIVGVSFYYADLYAIDQTLPRRELNLRLANGFGLICIVIAVVAYLLPQSNIQKVYLVDMLFIALGLYLWRLAYMGLLRKWMVRSKVLIVGTQSIATMVAEEIVRQKQLGLEVVGFVGAQPGSLTLTYGNPRRVSLPIFPRHAILGLVEKEGIKRILVDEVESFADFPASEPVLLRLKGIPIEDCHTFYERLTSKIAVADLQPSWLALSGGFRRTPWIMAMKRVIDIVVAGVGLVLSAPLSLLTAIAIKLDRPGPVLYRQERVGQNEKPFVLYKFRSMSSDAEVKTGPVWAQENDPRVTRVGRIIRKLRIDEIPQMVNVLKGEMSFVGPRPERPYFVAQLKEKIPYYSLRFSVKPGITGWAQILFPYGDSQEDAVEKLQYDLYYIKHISPLYDLQIILETFKVIIFGRGAQ